MNMDLWPGDLGSALPLGRVVLLPHLPFPKCAEGAKSPLNRVHGQPVCPERNAPAALCLWAVSTLFDRGHLDKFGFDGIGRQYQSDKALGISIVMNDLGIVLDRDFTKVDTRCDNIFKG